MQAHFYFHAPLNIPLYARWYCLRCGKKSNPYQTLWKQGKTLWKIYTNGMHITFLSIVRGNAGLVWVEMKNERMRSLYRSILWSGFFFSFCSTLNFSGANIVGEKFKLICLINLYIYLIKRGKYFFFVFFFFVFSWKTFFFYPDKIINKTIIRIWG